MKRSLDTCLIQNTKNTEGGHRCKKNRRNDALNKAVIPGRSWYSFASASVARRGCSLCVFFKGSGFYRDATRKSRCGCCDFLNRRGKRIAPLARIHFRSQATLCSFPERVRPEFHRLLTNFTVRDQVGQGAPQCGGKTAFPHIEGRTCTLASGLLSGSASVRIHSTSCVSHPAVGRASSRAF